MQGLAFINVLMGGGMSVLAVAVAIVGAVVLASIAARLTVAAGIDDVAIVASPNLIIRNEMSNFICF